MERENLIGFEIRTLSNLIKRYLDNSSTKKYVDKITGMHGWIIGYLFEHADTDIFQRDLEEKFSIRRSTATEILQLMEKNELIVREPVPQDARLKKLVLTPKAIEIHKMVSDEKEKLEAKLSAGISEEDMAVFFIVLNKIKKNIE